MVKVGDQIIAIDEANCDTINPCDWIIKGNLFDKKDKAQLKIKTKEGKIVYMIMERER